MAARERPLLKGPVTIEVRDDGSHHARYVTGAYRFLLSDGRVLDVTAIQDSSDLRAAVLHRFTEDGDDVHVVGVVKVKDLGYAD